MMASSRSFSVINLYLIFAFCYLIQGAVLAYTTNINKPMLLRSAIDAENLSTISMFIVLPFLLKIPVAFLVDFLICFKKINKYQFVIVGYLIFIVASILLILTSPQGDMQIFIAGLFLLGFGIAISDTAIDGISVDIVKEGLENTVQVVMLISRAMAIIIFSFLYGYFYDANRLDLIFVSFLILAIVSVIHLIFFYLKQKNRRKQVSPVISNKHFWRMKETFLLCLYGLVFAGIFWGGIEGISSLLLAENWGLNSVEIGHSGVARGTGMLIGSSLFGYLDKNLVRRRLYLIGPLLMSIAGALMLDSSTVSNYGTYSLLWGVGIGFQMTFFMVLTVRNISIDHGTLMVGVVVFFCNVGYVLGQKFTTRYAIDYGTDLMQLCLLIAGLLIFPIGYIVQKSCQYKNYGGQYEERKFVNT